MRRKRNSDIFVKILELGTNKQFEGVTLEEAVEHLKVDFPDLKSEHVHYVQELLRDNFYNITGEIPEKFYIKSEAYFNLLSYDEFMYSVHSSMEANRNAIAALFISIIAFIASITLSIVQINSDVSIDNDQFDVIRKQNLLLIENNKKLDKLINVKLPIYQIDSLLKNYLPDTVNSFKKK